MEITMLEDMNHDGGVDIILTKDKNYNVIGTDGEGAGLCNYLVKCDSGYDTYVPVEICKVKVEFSEVLYNGVQKLSKNIKGIDWKNDIRKTVIIIGYAIIALGVIAFGTGLL